MDRDNDLGVFLRARRNLVSPAEAGVIDDGARRVDGLRREEVALLAGMSADYYTRLEQGRERRPSEQVLQAIARALQLDRYASAHLFHLAQPIPHAAALRSPSAVGSGTWRLLDHVLDAPAFVLGPALDVLAANDLARTLYGGFAHLDNICRMVFLDPAALDFYDDWEHTAQGVVSHLRAASAPFQDDPRVEVLVRELMVLSPAFQTLWGRHEVQPRLGIDKCLHHPVVGEIRLRYEGFAVLDAPGQHLFVYTAEPGSPSADGLTLLRDVAASATVEADPVDCA